MNAKIGFWVMIVLSIGIFGFILFGNQSSAVNNKPANTVTTTTKLSAPQVTPAPATDVPVNKTIQTQGDENQRQDPPQRVNPELVGALDTAQ
jgi:hypothetical protein